MARVPATATSAPVTVTVARTRRPVPGHSQMPRVSAAVPCRSGPPAMTWAASSSQVAPPSEDCSAASRMVVVAGWPRNPAVAPLVTDRSMDSTARLSASAAVAGPNVTLPGVRTASGMVSVPAIS